MPRGTFLFRFLPIVTQAIGNLRVNLSKPAIQRLQGISLTQEWQGLQKLVSAGMRPSAERFKQYLQASCLQGLSLNERDKVIRCISDILRQEEELCLSTEPTLRDILVVPEANTSAQGLREVFLGQ